MPEIKEICFPVSEAAKMKSYQIVKSGARLAFLSESRIFTYHNVNLSSKLLDLARTYSPPENSLNFLRGFIFTHLILRTQAEMNKTHLPVITEEQRIEYYRESTHLTREKDINDIDYRRYNQLRVEEAELGEFIETLGRFIPGKIYLQKGATELYYIYKKFVG